MTIDQFLEHCREHTPDLEDIVSNNSREIKTISVDNNQEEE